MLQEVHCLNISFSSSHLLMNEGIRWSSLPSSTTLHTHTSQVGCMGFDDFWRHVYPYPPFLCWVGESRTCTEEREREMGLCSAF
jgi:hypothetical protein